MPPDSPIGTRGGMSSLHVRAGRRADIQFYLARGYSGDIDGLRGRNARDTAAAGSKADRNDDGAEASDGDDSLLDRNLKVRVPVAAGRTNWLSHSLELVFAPGDNARQPLQAHFNERRHPRITPAIQQVSITGPYSRRAAATHRAAAGLPAGRAEPGRRARQILSTLMRRAFRRPIVEADLERPLAFYREGKTGGGFDAGIERP